MRILTVFLILVLSWSAQAQVWTTRQNWSSGWEQRYSSWVRAHWQADFFARRRLPDGRPNPYHGLRADCADTVYSMRVVFAYENGLPFAINDPTGSGRLITNEMTRFDNLGQPARIRAFLEYVYKVVSTRTMQNDTYPVAIRKDTIRPGIMLKTVEKHHHSWTLKEMLPIGVPYLVFNSVIGANSGSMLQERKSWPNPKWFFEGNQTPQGHAGFRDWRPAAYLKRPVWEVPGYSEEQYRIPLSRWTSVVTSKLATRSESAEARLKRLSDAACADLKGRVTAVKEGVDYLNRSGGRCMNYETYDTYSTPSRDRRFFDALVELRAAYKESRGSISRETRDRMDKIFPFIDRSAREETSRMGATSVDSDSLCTVTYASGRKIDLAEAKRRMFAGLMSHNPLDDLEYRWGERRGPSSRARSCPSWDPWTPDLGTAD